jgi:hypothetical protein
MPENVVIQLPWKAIAQAIRERIESDVRTRVLPKIATGRNTVGDAVVALGQKLQVSKR